MPETEKLRLSETDKKIIKARLNGFSFCQLEGLELRTTCDKIILKTAAISGCPVPQTDYFAEVLTTEITEFINEFDFKYFTFWEIVLALRFNAKGGLRSPGNGHFISKVQFSGTCFNINFLSEVLNNYSLLREGLDRKFQNVIDGY